MHSVSLDALPLATSAPGTKRTSAAIAGKSAFDPKRTWVRSVRRENRRGGVKLVDRKNSRQVALVRHLWRAWRTPRQMRGEPRATILKGVGDQHQRYGEQTEIG
jgi:hypothetical protein